MLVHGLGSSSSFWDNVVPQLAPSFRTTAVDLPGHGPGARPLAVTEAAPARLAAALVDHLQAAGIAQPHLVGLSLGGWVVLEMAAMGYGASVVALAPAGLWRAGAHVPRELGVALGRRLLVAVRPLLPRLSRRAAVRSLGLRMNVAHPERVTPEQFLAAALALAQARGYGACDRAAVTARFERGAAVAVPVTVAFGDHDRVLSAETARERSLLPPGTNWVTVADCGHAVSWDQPGEAVALIESTARRACA